MDELPLGKILHGDCRSLLASLPAESIDLIFADPPYNLQLSKELLRPDNSRVDAVDDAWDQFTSFAEYDSFTRDWLVACKRVLKPNGSLWVIGSYHNIHRVGAILQDLGYWILNEIVWVKANPMPNFRGVRFTNAHETMLWASRERGSRYTYHHHAMKSLNDDLQMRSDWYLPLCTGRERLKLDGAKLHATQKPESLLYRVILASTNLGDIVLDPFFGTGTTGVMAQQLGRRWIGMERDPAYIAAAQARIDAGRIAPSNPAYLATANPRARGRIPFGRLLDSGLLHPGDTLVFGPYGDETAFIHADGTITFQEMRGSIHQIARKIKQGPCNGWAEWFYEDSSTKQKFPIDVLRERIRQMDEEAVIKPMDMSVTHPE
jgi:DNA modification methylase